MLEVVLLKTLLNFNLIFDYNGTYIYTCNNFNIDSTMLSSSKNKFFFQFNSFLGSMPQHSIVQSIEIEFVSILKLFTDIHISLLSTIQRQYFLHFIEVFMDIVTRPYCPERSKSILVKWICKICSLYWTWCVFVRKAEFQTFDFIAERFNF